MFILGHKNSIHFTYDPNKRISCEEALKHFYFKEKPTAIYNIMVPTLSSESEEKTRKPEVEFGFQSQATTEWSLRF